MQEQDEAKHRSHTAPFIAGEAIFQRNLDRLLHNDVHGSPRLHANRLQVEG